MSVGSASIVYSASGARGCVVVSIGTAYSHCTLCISIIENKIKFSFISLKKIESYTFLTRCVKKSHFVDTERGCENLF